MTRYQEGDWVKFRGHGGFMMKMKVLEVRPDDKLVVGQHDNDPKPYTINPDDVSNKL